MKDSRERRRTSNCCVAGTGENLTFFTGEKGYFFSLEDDLELEVLGWRLASGKANHVRQELQELPERKI